MANLIGFIDGFGPGLHITIINATTGKIMKTEQNVANKAFINALPTLFNPIKFKAVILNICYVNPMDFKNLYEFHKTVKETLDKMKVFTGYITKVNYVLTQTLIAGKINEINVGDTVLTVMSKEEGILVRLLEFTKNGWKVIRDQNLAPLFQYGIDIVRQAIIYGSNPKKIILSSGSFGETVPNFLKAALKSSHLCIVNRKEFVGVACWDVYKQMMNKSYIKYYIIPQLFHEYQIGFKYGGKDHHKIIAKNELIPFSKTVTVPRSSFEYYVSYTDPMFEKHAIVNTFMLKQNGHRNKITLKIDENYIISYQVKPVMLDGIKKLTVKLDESFDKAIPVIAFFDDYSVICIKKSDKYEFLKAWNGIYGKPLLISFDKEKPTYFEEAADVQQTKPSFVISDLINLMSRTIDEQIDIWKFKIITDKKNEETSVMLEFDNFDGSKKIASPTFLMAMLLKEHLKAIKDETGQKPAEISCCFPTQSDSDKKQRLEKGIQESCKMIKLDCSFCDF